MALITLRRYDDEAEYHRAYHVVSSQLSRERKGLLQCTGIEWQQTPYGSQQIPLIQAFQKVTFLLPGELKAPCLVLQGRTVTAITQSSLGHYLEIPPLFSAFVPVSLEIWSSFSV